MTVRTELMSYIHFLEEMKVLDEESLTKPVAEGKWSIKQIISHIYRWDIFLIEKAVPSALITKNVTFPSHDAYNEGSEKYSNTVSIEELLNQSIEIRRTLVEKLDNEARFLDDRISVNGFSHCTNTNSPYTLEYLMSEFAEHDKHHINQITQFLDDRNLSMS